METISNDREGLLFSFLLLEQAKVLGFNGKYRAIAQRKQASSSCLAFLQLILHDISTTVSQMTSHHRLGCRIIPYKNDVLI